MLFLLIFFRIPLSLLIKHILSPSQVMPPVPPPAAYAACLVTARFAPGTSHTQSPAHEFPQVLAYPIPGSRKNRLPMPSLFFLSKEFSRVPIPVSGFGQTQPCGAFIHESFHNEPLSFSSRSARPLFRTFPAVFCLSGSSSPQAGQRNISSSLFPSAPQRLH